MINIQPKIVWVHVTQTRQLSSQVYSQVRLSALLEIYSKSSQFLRKAQDVAKPGEFDGTVHNQSFLFKIRWQTLSKLRGSQT